MSISLSSARNGRATELDKRLRNHWACSVTLLVVPESSGLLTRFWPLVPTPLPALELYGSVACCAPYLATEKLTEVESFATNGNVGTLSNVAAPAVALSSANWM